MDHILIRPEVNELANTIDLEQTLIRAEALFRRFQRMVQAIDKKQNFPPPKLRQRPVQNASLGATQPLSGQNAVSGVATGSDATNERPNSPNSKGKATATEQDSRPKIISPELRKLFSRKVEVLPRKVVQKKGEGLDRKVKS
jgi:TBC1 domain family member 15